MRGHWLAFGLFLAGCTPSVQSHVEAYSEIPADAPALSVFILPYNEQDSGSLEWRQNAGVLASVLEAKGYTLASSPESAGLLAFFGFAADNGQRVTSTYSIPQWGQTGVSSSNTTGYIYGNSITSYTDYTPTYGITGYSTGTRSDMVYGRIMLLDLVDPRAKSTVFTAKVTSNGSCSSFSGVARPMVEAALSEFPSGKVGTVTLPMSGSC